MLQQSSVNSFISPACIVNFLLMKLDKLVVFAVSAEMVLECDRLFLLQQVQQQHYYFFHSCCKCSLMEMCIVHCINCLLCTIELQLLFGYIPHQSLLSYACVQLCGCGSIVVVFDVVAQ